MHPITAVQMEWSLAERGIEASLVPTCRELGVAIVAYSPLSRGLLTGSISGVADVAGAHDRRAHLPRFAPGACEANAARAGALKDLGARLHATPAQLSLAWLLRQGEFVFPIPGSKTVGRVAENWGAVAIASRLTEEEVAAIGALSFAAEGNRYPAAGSAHIWEARA